MFLFRSSKSAMAAVPSNIAIVAAGCFWGVENYYLKHYKDALGHTEVGYIGGKTDDPTYKAVCTGKTDHAEGFRMEFDPAKVSYEELCRFFFRLHDPTTLNRQQGDIGTQYRSAIFYLDDAQREIALRVLEEARVKWSELRPGAPIVTEIVKAGKWYSAEEYHQKYLQKNPGGYCSHRIWY